MKKSNHREFRFQLVKVLDLKFDRKTKIETKKPSPLESLRVDPRARRNFGENGIEESPGEEECLEEEKDEEEEDKEEEEEDKEEEDASRRTWSKRVGLLRLF